MTLTETLRAMKQIFLNEVSPTKQPAHPKEPIFYTDEQKLAMDWEARMQARAMHRLDPHTSVVSLHEKILHDMHERYYADPEYCLRKIMKSYRECLSAKDDIQFEDEYVNKKVNYYHSLKQHSVQSGR